MTKLRKRTTCSCALYVDGEGRFQHYAAHKDQSKKQSSTARSDLKSEMPVCRRDVNSRAMFELMKAFLLEYFLFPKMFGVCRELLNFEGVTGNYSKRLGAIV